MRAVWIPLLAASLVSATQSPFQSHLQSWDSPPSPDVTGHLIFQAVGGLLQHFQNTRYPKGHSIVPATISPGTILYHGRPDGNIPTGSEWLAFDPEHSQLFARGDSGHIMSFVSTRQLKLIYFDGTSASKTSDGTMDTQDILTWGEVNKDKPWREMERLTDMCKWGKPYGIDGYIRMEPDFEIMYCNFTQGLEVVSNINVVPPGSPGRFVDEFFEAPPRQGPPGEGPPREGPPGRPGRPRRPPTTPPSGWKGSLRDADSVMFEFFHAGAWHDFAPGESRVHLDLSSIITFYDPSLSSLVASRRSQSRDVYRAGNISASDIIRVRQNLVDALTRPKDSGSGIDWRGLVQVITDRYSDRLPLLQYILRPSSEFNGNVTAQAAQFRAQLLIMLSPYISRTSVPSNTTTERSHAWVKPVARNCAVLAWSIPTDALTPQERVIRNGIDETLREICRVLSLMWADAFAVEEEDHAKIANLLKKWRGDVDQLMVWLDWTMWSTCAPACGPQEICYIPEWPWNRRWDQVDTKPRCIPRLPPYSEFRW